jgi:ribokinase
VHRAARRCDDADVALRIVVVGSVNLDLVARVERLPAPGETVGGATFARVPGGKGANQAVACARLGAEVTMIGAVGSDVLADEALDGLREAGVALELRESTEPTGVALIQVDGDGETTIAVAPGANGTLGAVELPTHDAVLCQLEIPDEAVLSAWEECTGLFCLNAAPARPLAVDADLAVVNRHELDALVRRDGLVALTLGAEGAVLLDDGEEVARAVPPPVEAVDGTAAGDAFTACLLVSLLDERTHEEALRRACAAGALAASRFGAQPSLPTAAEIDAILDGS